MRRLLLGLLFLASIIGTAARADVGGSIQAGADAVDTPTPTDTLYGGSVRVGASAHLNPFGIQLLDVDGTVRDTQYDNSTHSFEVRANGALLYSLRLQDLLYRQSTALGDQTRVMAGLGLGMRHKFSKTAFLAVSASVGLFYMSVVPWLNTNVNYGGFYGAGNVEFHVWRLRNSLRVAAYRAESEGSAAGSLTWNSGNITGSIDKDINTILQGIKGAPMRFIVDEDFRYVLFDLPFVSLEPGVRAELAQLPLESELNVLVGVSGRLGQ